MSLPGAGSLQIGRREGRRGEQEGHINILDGNLLLDKLPPLDWVKKDARIAEQAPACSASTSPFPLRLLPRSLLSKPFFFKYSFSRLFSQRGPPGYKKVLKKVHMLRNGASVATSVWIQEVINYGW